MSWCSKDILKRPEWSLQRAFYKSMGYSDYDLERPLIGIANSWNRVVPGHYNLNLVSDYVKQGIRQAGGTPLEFGVIAACDGIAQGHDGMHYILPTRDLISIDIPNRSLHPHISDEGIEVRLAGWQRPEPKFKKGYLALYARLAESADKGAILRHKFE